MKQGPLAHRTAALPVVTPVMASPQLHVHESLASNVAIAYMGKYYMAIYGTHLVSFNSRARRRGASPM